MPNYVQTKNSLDCCKKKSDDERRQLATNNKASEREQDKKSENQLKWCIVLRRQLKQRYYISQLL